MLKLISTRLLSVIIVVLFASLAVFADAASDSTLKKSDYKLSKKEFYAKYAPKGADTINQQIIDHYFYRRKDGLHKVSAFPVALVFTGVMVTTSLLAGDNDLVASVTFYGGIFGAVGTLIGIPVSIGGLKTCKKYNRKNLAILLKEIQSGKKDGKAVLDNFIRYELPDADE